MKRSCKGHFIEGMRYPLADDAQMTPPEPCELSVGDLVTFTNDYGAVFKNLTVTGFSARADYGRFVYFDSSSWWFPVSPGSLKIQNQREEFCSSC